MTLNIIAIRRERRSQIILEQQHIEWSKYVAEVMSNASKNGMR